MLPPLQLSSNSPHFSRGARVEGGAATGAEPGNPAAGQTPSGLDLNSAIVGKLNLMLLSSDERVAQNFLAIADIFGRSLGLQRKTDETAASFARRIVEALALLPPAKRNAIEHQLGQLFNGLKLQTVIDAFSNPSGPQAARIALHLELPVQPGRDPLTKTVVGSYQLNAADPAEPARPPATNAKAAQRTLPATDAPVRQPGSEALQPIQQRSIAHSTPGETDRPSIRMTNVEPTTGGSGHLSDPGPREPARGIGEPIAKGGQPSSVAPSPGSTAAQSSQSVHLSSDDDVMALQRRLQQHFGQEREEASGPTTRPGIRHEPTIELREERWSIGPKPDERASGSPPNERGQTLFVLKGWKEAPILPPLPGPAPEGDGLTRLLRTTLFATPAPAATEEATPAEPGTVSSSTTAKRPADTDTAQEAQPRSAANRPGSAQPLQGAFEPTTAALSPVGAEAATIATAPSAREGVALPVVNYLTLDDYEEAKREEEHRQRNGSGDAESFADQRHGDEREDTRDEDEPADVLPPTEDQTGSESTSPVAQADPDGTRANDLYWRMAGWS